ncbi:iron-containing alcohol dehydrogenase [Acetobacterium malicum]|uniref:Iron-containing alcohol dehydrogenase n=1 Tax=Acetobacterium malicum TaxID=52692 RepID=A0ABR6YS64_9FIRM|nr:iron-containing alcohol dehydrogenase [Acetobacterium malicum]MBC3898048.1 iron-containing alcohol dehydrogenase [Acetobacterium malicum]
MAIADQVFGFFMPVVNLMGPGSVKEVGVQAKSLGLKKALIVTDAGLEKMGVADQVKEIIEAAGLKVIVFAGAQPNPTDINVHDGLAIFKENKCDLIVSLGGGSSHDCAKGIGLVAGNGGHIRDFEGVNKSKKAMKPLIAINTTAGTASEMTRFCIITNTDTHVKMAIVDWRCTPTISVNDPVMMMGMPPALTAATGMDALTHSVEAYMSTIATPVTDAAALMSIKLIGENLRQAVANGQNFAARNNMAYAQFLGGMAFNNASLGYVHGMAHQLGGFYDLPHGVCNAILLPHVQRFNLNSNPQRLADIAVALGENISGLSVRDAAEKGLDAIVQLSQDIGIPAGLAALGAKEEDFEVMAVNAMKDACSATNPRQAKLEDVIQIFKNAL